MSNTSIYPCLSLYDPPQCQHFGWCVPQNETAYRCLCHGGSSGYNCSFQIYTDSGHLDFVAVQPFLGALCLVAVVVCVLAVVEGEVNLRRGTTW